MPQLQTNQVEAICWYIVREDGAIVYSWLLPAYDIAGPDGVDDTESKEECNKY